MPEKKNQNQKKSFTPDWLIRGILGRLGEIFDKLTGRKWQPSSNLATSELAEKLISLLDSNVRDLNIKGKFVPHYIILKVQWDKFSTDSEENLAKLKTELMAKAVDYINDFHLHTFAPLKIEVKTDYFVKGVEIYAGYEDSSDEQVINMSLSESDKPIKEQLNEGQTGSIIMFTVRWAIDNREKTQNLKFPAHQRLSVGRSSQNDLQIDDPSVSKIHASLYINAENQLTVADTGSTNGTFINEQRIEYGKSLTINAKDLIKFGSINVSFEQRDILRVESDKIEDEKISATFVETEVINSKTVFVNNSIQNVSISDLGNDEK